MISLRWLDKRRTHWERLEQLVESARTGLSNLTGAELQELGLLYRQTASDLSTVVEDPASGQIAVYLNHLLGRSHNLLYSGARPKPVALVAFFRREYPAVFRETLPLTSTAVAIFTIAMIIGWAITLHDVGFAHRILGPKMMDTIERRQMWTNSVVAVKPLASSAITTNNLSVAFAAFAFGITGIGTIWMIFFNGLMLGVVGAATARAGMALSLWSFVAAHGVLELPAICIAGGAGLELARGLLFPGMLPRRVSLSLAGSRSVRLLIGTIPLLLVAGSIEGFISPTNLPAPVKFSLAGLLFAALIAYLFFTGKRSAPVRGSFPLRILGSFKADSGPLPADIR